MTPFIRPLKWAFLTLAMLLVLNRTIPLPKLPLGDPQTVITRNSKIGIHTRFTDEVETWKIKYSLQLVREMGAPWIVEYFPWAYYESFPGIFSWEHPDTVINHANWQGITVIARLGFVPKWARPDDTSPTFLSPDRYDDFGNYVYEFVKRYRGKVNYIIIWNEPNLALEWGFQPIDPVGYTELLKVAYRRAKEANPDVQVLGGALAPTLAPAGDEFGMNDLDYLQAMLDAGAGTAMDALAVHAYGWVYPADDPPAPDVVNFRRVELVQKILADNGYADMPIHITEAGWNDHPRWTRAVKPGQRIEYTLAAYRLAEQWDWLASLNMWAFRYPRSAQSYQDYFTFVTPDFVKKPIYDEVKNYATEK